MKNVIQNFIFARHRRLSIGDRILHFAGDYEEVISGKDICIRIKANNCVYTSTFYNIFSISKWTSLCSIDNLQVFLKGSGKVDVEVYYRPHFGIESLLSAFEFELDEIPQFYNIPIEGRTEGVIILKISAISDVSIVGGGYATTNSRRNKVRLGVVVTHFNNLESVKRTITDFSSEQKINKEEVNLIVVDNSSNIPAEFYREGVEIVRNSNFGGSGGYARGKLYLENNGYTHCIFMDDDVGVDPECIYRVQKIYEYARLEFSISGLILSKDDGHTVLQVGGRYKNGFCWIPVCSGYDMADLADLIKLNRTHAKIDFGAFPFYAFPLKSSKNYPFPFFVRGDDVLFGLQQSNLAKKFWLGIGVLISRSGLILKECPHTLYQDCRALIAIELMSKNKSSLLKVLRIYTRMCLSQVFSYKYASAHAVNSALLDVLKGPSFFENELDQRSIRERNKKFNVKERYEWTDETEEVECSKNRHSLRIIRLITLNGLLLPVFLLRRKAVLQNKGFRASFREIFGYRYVCYESLDGKRLIVAQDKCVIFKLLLKWLSISISIVCSYKKLKHSYVDCSSRMTSKKFWSQKYDL